MPEPFPSRDPCEFMIQRRFENELGNNISMIATMNTYEPAVTVYAAGPTSDLSHRWTTLEAIALRDMLDHLLSNSAPLPPEGPKP